MRLKVLWDRFGDAYPDHAHHFCCLNISIFSIQTGVDGVEHSTSHRYCKVHLIQCWDIWSKHRYNIISGNIKIAEGVGKAAVAFIGLPPREASSFMDHGGTVGIAQSISLPGVCSATKNVAVDLETTFLFFSISFLLFVFSFFSASLRALLLSSFRWTSSQLSFIFIFN